MRVTRPAKPVSKSGQTPDAAPINTWRYGWLIRPGSLWIGAHWSPANKRLCINVVPCVTVWVVLPGGFAP